MPFALQGELKRGRLANRLGITLFLFLVLVLVASFANGLRLLGAL